MDVIDELSEEFEENFRFDSHVVVLAHHEEVTGHLEFTRDFIVIVNGLLSFNGYFFKKFANLLAKCLIIYGLVCTLDKFEGLLLGVQSGHC